MRSARRPIAPQAMPCLASLRHDSGPRRPRTSGSMVVAGQPGSLVLRGNAFNFPVWAPLEKLAQAVLAGMPSVVKPATPRHSSCASSSTRSPPARCIGRGLGASGAELGDLGLGDGGGRGSTTS